MVDNLFLLFAEHVKNWDWENRTVIGNQLKTTYDESKFGCTIRLRNLCNSFHDKRSIGIKFFETSFEILIVTLGIAYRRGTVDGYKRGRHFVSSYKFSIPSIIREREVDSEKFWEILFPRKKFATIWTKENFNSFATHDLKLVLGWYLNEAISSVCK